MHKRQITVACKMKILFLLALFLLYGCATTQKAISLKTPKQNIRPRITDDVLAFLDLQQIDLDKDGVKEIVAVYSTGINSSGVKVIKLSQDTGSVIFKRIFNTPNTKLIVEKNIPTLIVQEKDYTTGRILKDAYCWDGKGFIPVVK